ncbi:MAG: NAD(+) diphosphatase [Myxococcota bacterium]
MKALPMPTPLPTELTFDRCAELRSREDDLRAAEADESALFIPVWRNKTPVRMGATPRALALTHGEASHWLRGELESKVFLGRLGSRPVFSLGLPGGAAAPPIGDGAFKDLRPIGLNLPPADVAVLAYARGMSIWHRYQRHCGRCGVMMRAVDGGHVRLCPACDTRHFPRTDPAMMALVMRGDRVLLARSPRFPPKMVSILAGFTEPGESLEDSVVREVREEVGLEVKDVRYVKSQPWPFPHSLMLGFVMRSEEGELRLDEDEIEAADFYSRAQIERADEIWVPPVFSLAGQLIRAWMAGDFD